MNSILQQNQTIGETTIVSFRVPVRTHEKLRKMTDLAKNMGMRITWQNLLREHLEEYIQLADRELKKYGTHTKTTFTT